MLNDPQLLQQSLQIASNPSLMREHMRTSDRALSNIEAMPEGFNALRRMFENVQASGAMPYAAALCPRAPAHHFAVLVRLLTWSNPCNVNCVWQPAGAPPSCSGFPRPTSQSLVLQC